MPRKLRSRPPERIASGSSTCSLTGGMSCGWISNGRGNRMRPLIIGVVGGSGSGKTTVARAIQRAMAWMRAFLDQDGYYKDLSHLTLEERKQVNFDHPDSIDARPAGGAPGTAGARRGDREADLRLCGAHARAGPSARRAEPDRAGGRHPALCRQAAARSFRHQDLCRRGGRYPLHSPAGARRGRARTH